MNLRAAVPQDPPATMPDDGGLGGTSRDGDSALSAVELKPERPVFLREWPNPMPVRGTASSATACQYRPAGPFSSARRVSTALTAAAGTGGAAALLLAFRRQRHTEHASLETRHAAVADRAQREAQARDATEDARERRVTELYGRALDQLGSERAPVRLGGLYALERLAVP